MDLLHHVWKTVLGGECLKFGDKVERIDRVLDVGTGTGKQSIVLWAGRADW
jgi:methylase of polypeptide subunit release factors